MLVRRYSGRVKLVCRFRDRENDYDCEVIVDGESVGHSYVGLPNAWATLPEYKDGVDSDEAFDSAARAAFAFAMDDMFTEEPLISSEDVEWDEEGIVVRRRPLSSSVPDPQTSLDFGRRRP